MGRLLRLLHIEADVVVPPQDTARQRVDDELDAIRQEQAEQRAVVDLLQQVAVARGWVTPEVIAAVKKVDEARERTSYHEPRGGHMVGPDEQRGAGQP